MALVQALQRLPSSTPMSWSAQHHPSISPSNSPAVQRCPLCDVSFSNLRTFPTQKHRDDHLNRCLDDFHGLTAKMRDEDAHKARFAKAESKSVFSQPPGCIPNSSGSGSRAKRQLLTADFLGRKRIRMMMETPSATTRRVTLESDTWRRVVSFVGDLAELRSCSRLLCSLCEREALSRLSTRLWMRVIPDDSIDINSIRRQSFVATEHQSTKHKLEVIPCVNVSLDGALQAHLIFLKSNSSFKGFVRQWEAATGLRSDRAQFVLCFGNKIKTRLSNGNFPSPSKLREIGVFAYEQLPPLSPQHTRISLHLKGILATDGEPSSRFIGLPLMIAVPFGSTRSHVHRAVFRRVRRFLRQHPEDNTIVGSAQHGIPYKLLTPASSADDDDEAYQETMTQGELQTFPNDRDRLIASSRLVLVADFGRNAAETLEFSFLGRKLPVDANTRCLSASTISVMEALVERDCRVRIL